MALTARTPRFALPFAVLAATAAGACAQPLMAPPPVPGAAPPAAAVAQRSANPFVAQASAAAPPTVGPPPEAFFAPPPMGSGPAIEPGMPIDGACDDGSCGDGVGERHWFYNHARLRRSTSHGRAMGPGGPLRGTSWLNRPYWAAYEFGAFVMTDGPEPNVRKGNDTFNALQIGLDFDHYWGAQFRVGVTSPKLLNTTQLGVGDPEELLWVLDASFVYYPWGDSRLRPYYRVGVGLTDLEYINDAGVKVDEKLLTLPIGVGFKHHLSRSVVLRFELMDNIAVGMNDTSTLNNLTLTSGLEWRFGNATKYLGGWSGHHHKW